MKCLDNYRRSTQKKIQSNFFLKAVFSLGLLSLTSAAQAHCPVDLGAKSNLCATVTWLKGPTLNIKSQDRVFSEVDVLLFKKGDTTHTPVTMSIEIFPWMTMSDGSEHATRYTLKQLSNGHYSITNIRFFHTDMGWTLRFANVAIDGTFDAQNGLLASVPVVFEVPAGTASTHSGMTMMPPAGSPSAPAEEHHH